MHSRLEGRDGCPRCQPLGATSYTHAGGSPAVPRVGESLTKSASSTDDVLASVATVLTAMRDRLETVAAVAAVALKAQAAGLLV